MADTRKHRGRYHSRGRFSLLYTIFTALLIAVVIVGGSIVFFKVNHFDLRMKTRSGNVVTLEGNSRYTEEEVIEACGVRYQDNLCLVKKTSVANNVLTNLSYVAGVSVSRRFPGTLVITITEGTAAAAIRDGKQWYAIDANGKLLEAVSEQPDCAEVTGLVLKDPRVGEYMQVHQGKEKDYEGDSQVVQRDALLQLLPAMEGRGLMRDITALNMSSDSALEMTYQGRLRVKMPLECDFEYQTKLFATILEDYIAVNWSEQDSGTLDMTYKDGQTHLTRDEK